MFIDKNLITNQLKTDYNTIRVCDAVAILVNVVSHLFLM